MLFEVESEILKSPLTVCCPVSGQYQYPDTENRVCLNVAGRDSRVEVAGAGAGKGRG